MSRTTSIEWTEATWNPVRGCTRVSPGCMHCYAEREAYRHANPGGAYEGLVQITNGHPQWTGNIRMVGDKLDEPLRRRKPSMYFVNSMSDLFHDDVPSRFIASCFGVMLLSQRHTFQILTKRPAIMQEFMQRWNARRCLAQAFDWLGASATCDASFEWPPKNVWLGVSVESQKYADERIPLLLQTPAAVRFISAEPLLEEISLRWAKWDVWEPHPRRIERLWPGAIDHLDGARMLDWVIAGGESGPGARPCNLAWINSLRLQCLEAQVPFFAKQIGSNPRTAKGTPFRPKDPKGGDMLEWPEDLRVRQWPKAKTEAA